MSKVNAKIPDVFKTQYLNIVMTSKGLALIDAIEAGLVRPDGSGSYDTTAFNDFWRRLERREEDRRRLWRT